LKSIFKKIAVVSSGTVLAQLIPFICLPLLTRLFTKVNFGEFALYFSLVAILSMLFTFRLEQTVVLSKDREQMTIRVRAVTAQVCLGFLIALILVSFNPYINELINLPQIYILTIPLSALCTALILTYTFVLLWNENYKSLALFKLANAILYISFSIFLGLFISREIDLNGLIVGWFCAQFLITIFLFFYLRRCGINCLPRFNSSLYKNFKDIIIFNFPSSLVDRVSQETPNLTIAQLYSVKELGFYSMVVRILGAPIALLGVAISQVLVKEVSSSVNNRESIKRTMIRMFITMLFVSAATILIFSLLTENQYAFILGEEWRDLGPLVLTVLPSFAIKLLVVPLSSVLLPLKRLKILAFWQVLFFISISYLFFMVEQSFYAKIQSFVLLEIILYLFYLFIIFYSTWRYEQKLALNTKE
jgi:O-antigen/teichoic acid export membrane protein